jgi:hypothetical protein
MAVEKSKDQNSDPAAKPVAAKPSYYDKRIANLRPFKPGQSGNPKGRRKGQRDFRTIYWIAAEEVARLHGMTPEEVEVHLYVAAISKGLKGDFFFFQELMNRVHGKITDKVDVTSGGKTLAELISAAHAWKRKQQSPTGDKRGKRTS